MHKSMQQTSDKAIFEFCGIDVIKHMFLGAVPSSTEEGRNKYLSEIEDVVRANC